MYSTYFDASSKSQSRVVSASQGGDVDRSVKERGLHLTSQRSINIFNFDAGFDKTLSGGEN
jgi:hypothetical protein